MHPREYFLDSSCSRYAKFYAIYLRHIVRHALTPIFTPCIYAIIYAKHLRHIVRQAFTPQLPCVTVPAATPCSSMTVRVVFSTTSGISSRNLTTMSYSNSCLLNSFVHGGIPDPMQFSSSPSYRSFPTIRLSRDHLSGFLANHVVWNGWIGVS